MTIYQAACINGVIILILHILIHDGVNDIVSNQQKSSKFRFSNRYLF
jgi:hypothetical protein